MIRIACFLNRSIEIDKFYHSKAIDCLLPVISLVRMPVQEWKQNDPAVAEDIAKGNVVWKPKNEWNRLEQAMKV